MSIQSTNLFYITEQLTDLDINKCLYLEYILQEVVQENAGNIWSFLRLSEE